jgi:hypothetical protein
MTRHCQYPLCPHPDHPLAGKAIKYHLECQRVIDREKTIARGKRFRERHKNDPKPKKKRELCECCGIYEIAPGFRKLCHLCWTWDGKDWMNEHRYEKPKVAQQEARV